MSDTPRSTPSDSFTHDQYAARVRAFLDFDRFDDAQREVHTALGTYPHDDELLSLATWVEHFHGTPGEAQRLARATLAVQADDWRAHIVLTESLLGQGNVAASAETARRLLSYYPDHAGTHLNYAYALAHDTRGVGVPEGADQAELLTLHIEEALALEPENASHFARASTFMQMRGEFGRARDLIAEALALDPTNSSYITQSAGLDEHDRDAFAKLKGALALSPGDTQAAFVLHERAWHLFGYGVLVTLGILTGMVFWFTFLFGISSEDTSHRTLVRLAGVLFIPALFWVIIWVRAFASLPRGYLRLTLKTAPWLWIAIVTTLFAVVGQTLVAMGVLTHLGATFQEMLGDDPTSRVQGLLWLFVALLITELLMVVARVRTESDQNLIDTTQDGVFRARRLARESRIALIVRSTVAAAVAATPWLFASSFDWPVLTWAFILAALAIGAPAVVDVVLRSSRLRSVTLHDEAAPRRSAVAAGIVGVIALAAAASIAWYATEAFEQEETCLTCGLDVEIPDVTDPGPEDLIPEPLDMQQFERDLTQ